MSVLLVQNTMESDNVVFSVNAENKAGIAKCSANLVVERKSRVGTHFIIQINIWQHNQNVILSAFLHFLPREQLTKIGRKKT